MKKTPPQCTLGRALGNFLASRALLLQAIRPGVFPIGVRGPFFLEERDPIDQAHAFPVLEATREGAQELTGARWRRFLAEPAPLNGLPPENASEPPNLPVTGLLITGGSGFLGQALVRRVLGCPAVTRLCVFSRGEFAQAEMRDSIDDADGRMRWFIGDVRDRDRLRWACQGIDTVIHAAALKRIEVGAYSPSEMVATNVTGTANVIDACAYAGVKRAVLVSSDKAWQPVSPYGQSKALAESLWLAAGAERHGPTFSAVRYGNVAGSTGSVIPRWRRMLRARRCLELPVTDPEVTRFWMTVDQAVELVLQAAASAGQGELRLPEALPAFRLGDLCQAMAAEARVVGLPAWEKRHEGLADGYTSDLARRMSVEELADALLALDELHVEPALSTAS